MMKINRLLIVFLVLSSLVLKAQQVYTGDYRSGNNPFYWKNKMPDAAYWQQDVHYKINASIDEKKHFIKADEELTYWNNSPDTLQVLYFHLYQNAFVKGSYLSELYNENKIKPKYSYYANQGLGTQLEQIKIDGQNVKFELDNTILKIYLNKPLAPNASLVFSTQFQTYFGEGTIRRRMAMYNAWGWMHYNGVHWYPRICVYDRRKGWDLEQHLNKELYGDFGTFEVNLTFANNYIVEATGELVNESEVLPNDLKQKLAISNFKNKVWDEAPSEIIKYDSSQRKTWKFKAINVHDFAFTADPSYRIMYAMQKGVRCVAIAQEPHCAKWQNAAEYTTKIIKTFSDDFGDYIYPKMVVADADDGMEYPMITLDGGADPGYRGLFVHEVGHNWFYGMLGSNETYRAMLDEGFTQFITEWGQKKIDGDVMVEDASTKKYYAKFHQAPNVSDRAVYSRYLAESLQGEMVDMNRHSNDYHGGLAHENGYGQVYYKPAVMLNNLRYTLGDSLFLETMQAYVSRWKVAHPYVSDFRQAIHDACKLDLDWFFDEWIEQADKNINYKIKQVKAKNDSLEIKIKRTGTMIMPIDLAVINTNGDTAMYQIPNTYFHKKEGGKVLSRWFAFDGMNATYTAKVPNQKSWKTIMIDPKNYLADLNLLNNTKTKKFFSKDKFSFGFDSQIPNLSDRRKYEIKWRPDLWWNKVDGLKIGLHLNGNYQKLIHNFDFTVWKNTEILSGNLISINRKFLQGTDYTFNYATVFPRAPRLGLQLHSRKIEDFFNQSIGLTYRTKNNWNLSSEYRIFYRIADYLKSYLYLNQWDSYRFGKSNFRPNSFVESKISKYFKHYNGYSWLELKGRTTFNPFQKTTYFNYQQLTGEWKRNFRYKKLDFKTRAFAQFGTGIIPVESKLYLGSGNMEEAMDNKFTRSIGWLTGKSAGSFSNTNILQANTGGGLNLRGYNGLAMQTIENSNYQNYETGNSGVSLNAEMDFDDYVKFKPKLFKNWLHLDAYVFGDIGLINNRYNDEKYRSSPVYADAGLGFAFTIKKWSYLSQIKPLTIRFDFPVWVNRPNAYNPDYLLFRYIIGINRSF